MLSSQGRVVSSLAQVEQSQQCLEESQTRIEAHLTQILATQKQKTPNIAHSLDASSPEGRQIWMNLGRLLRIEGITPDMIEKNKSLLINAMKTTLMEDPSVLGSFADSYRTAPEYPDEESRAKHRRFGSSVHNAGSSLKHSLLLRPGSLSPGESSSPRHAVFPNHRQIHARLHQFLEEKQMGAFSAHDSSNIFGSAPPRPSAFPEHLKKDREPSYSLGEEQFVEAGLSSLLLGMNSRTLISGQEANDLIATEQPVDVNTIEKASDLITTEELTESEVFKLEEEFSLLM